MRPGYLNQPELLADALTEWQAFFDELNAERTANFSNPDFVYPVTGPGSQSGGNGYTVGPQFTFSGTTTIASLVVTVDNTAGLQVGNAVSGAGIPALATITAISPNVSITLSLEATAAALITITVTPDWVGPRPESIIRANLVMTSAGQAPIYLQLTPISQEEWSALAIRQIPAINVTSKYWYDPQYPDGVFNVFPPLNGNSIELFTWGVLAAPTSLQATYSAPPGYWDLVVLGLAERLYYMATKEVVIRPVPYQIIAGKAHAAREKIRLVNRPIPRLRTDCPSGSRIGGSGFYDQNVRWTGEPY